MKAVPAVVLLALCSAAANVSAAQSATVARSSHEDTIIAALNEAIPLGKEAIRAFVKPMLDTVTISPREEMEIGDAFYRQIGEELEGRLDVRRRDVEYVTAVGQALARQARRKGIVYRFHVVEEAVPNAFAIPGGHVFVYRGLLDRIVLNEAQLAAVLTRDRHVDAEHGVDFSSRQGFVTERRSRT